MKSASHISRPSESSSEVLNAPIPWKARSALSLTDTIKTASHCDCRVSYFFISSKSLHFFIIGFLGLGSSSSSLITIVFFCSSDLVDYLRAANVATSSFFTIRITLTMSTGDVLAKLKCLETMSKILVLNLLWISKTPSNLDSIYFRFSFLVSSSAIWHLIFSINLDYKARYLLSFL